MIIIFFPGLVILVLQPKLTSVAKAKFLILFFSPLIIIFSFISALFQLTETFLIVHYTIFLKVRFNIA